MGEKNRSGVRTELRDGRKILIIDFRFRDKDGREKRYRRDAAVQITAGGTRGGSAAEEAGGRARHDGGRAGAADVRAVRARRLQEARPASLQAEHAGGLRAASRQAASTGLWRCSATSASTPSGRPDVRVVEADALARKARPRYAIVCLHTVLRCAVELGILEHMPKLPKLPPRSKKLPSAPPLAVVEQLLGESRGWLRVAVALAALGGLRSGEARALEVGDVHLAARRLHVRRAFSAEEMADPKGLDERMVPLAPLLSPSWSGRWPGGRRPSGSSSARAAAAHREPPRKRLARCRRGSASSPRWHYHQLRHFFATRCARRREHRDGPAAARPQGPRFRRRVTCTRRGATWWPPSRYCRETAGKRPRSLVPSFLGSLLFS